MTANAEFHRHQRETARELGYGDDVDAMNEQHDPLHRALCKWLGVTSHAMREASGELLTDQERDLALLEESAVMAVQAFLRHAGVRVPEY